MGAVIKESRGDLFQLKGYVLAHCISADVTKNRGMGAGIAKTFRQKYPRMPGAISVLLKPDQAVRYRKGDQVIYNLVTKERFYHHIGRGIDSETYYRNLRNALVDMRDQMQHYGETRLAIPRIGSGLDRGDWKVIKDIIEEVFASSEIEVLIKYL